MLVVALGAAAYVASAALHPLGEASDASPHGWSPEQRFAYAVGAKFVEDLGERDDVELDGEQLVRGVRDAVAGSLRLTRAERDDALQQFVELQAERLDRETARRLAEYESRGRAFLAENARRPEVVSLPSGLQYEVIERGTGARPGLNDTVTCHYRGTLLDGTPFDDTRSRGRPMTFVVANVVAGWEEALQMMPAGSRWKLYLPPELAYGADGFDTRIPPHATLIFDVELLAVGSD